jgi:2-polyprenyl-3-methyl-5-hydroxy-6-metoxy-1,4-benzoquinol methylase
MAPCGYGWFFDRFRRDGIEVVGVDIVPETLGYARTAVNPPVPVFQADIQQLPFADGQFEFIVTNRFLLHFEDGFRALAFKELARVTRKYLLVHYDTPSLHELMRGLRGFRKPDLDLDELQGWRKRKRKNRRLFYDRERMAAEGAGAGFTVRRLYHVFYLLSARVYCLYEKIGAP